MRQLNADSVGFYDQLSEATAWDEVREQEVDDRVAGIIRQVRDGGDTALLELTNQLDNSPATSLDALHYDRNQLQQIADTCPIEQRQALEQAAERIRHYHQHQIAESWSYRDELGNLLGQKVTPIERAGIYVPGGKAAYPSSVLMNAIPARVAGVHELVMVSPMPGGEPNPMVLAAALVAGVDRVYAVGGAQAVAALAFGTESVPRVDKIVGPGNAYVASAKRQLFGRVGIDMIAGPSEIMVIADDSADPEWLAMDLLSQAEHDEEAQAVLVSDSQQVIDAVLQALEQLLPTLERSEIARASIDNRGLAIRVANLAGAAEVANRVAPEHLELAVRDPEALLGQISNAGAIFLGSWSPEAVGDYCAGPNHVLPTSATARFSSPLGVYDFQKRTSLIGCTAAGASDVAKIASVMARGESLTAHARSAEYRIQSNPEE